MVHHGRSSGAHDELRALVPRVALQQRPREEQWRWRVGTAIACVRISPSHEQLAHACRWEQLEVVQLARPAPSRADPCAALLGHLVELELGQLAALRPVHVQQLQQGQISERAGKRTEAAIADLTH
jgi:hypothetical protein